MGWFDQIDLEDTTDPDNADTATDAREALPDQDTAEEEKEQKQKTRAPLIIGGGAAAALVLVAGAGYAALSGLQPEEDTVAQQAAAGNAESSLAPTVAADNDEQEAKQPPADDPHQAVGPGCETPAEAQPGDTPADAVIAFQKAYFESNAAGVRDLLAQDSPLNETEWETVLDGSFGKDSWCVTVTGTEGETVEATTTGMAGEEPVQFEQAVTTKSGEHGPRIFSVENRS